MFKKVFQSRGTKDEGGEDSLLRFLRVRAICAHVILFVYHIMKYAGTDWEHIEESCPEEIIDTYDDEVHECIPINFDAEAVIKI